MMMIIFKFLNISFIQNSVRIFTNGYRNKDIEIKQIVLYVQKCILTPKELAQLKLQLRTSRNSSKNIAHCPGKVSKPCLSTWSPVH